MSGLLRPQPKNCSRLDAAKLGRVVGNGGMGGGTDFSPYSFGLDAKACAAALRALADDVERGATHLQRVHTGQRSDRDEFPVRSVFIRYVSAEALPEPPLPSI